MLTLQNGVDNPDRLASQLGSQHVLAGAARMEANLVEPGAVRLSSRFARIDFAEWSTEPTGRAERVLAALQAAGIDAHLVADVRRALWDKFLFLASVAGLTSLARLTVGEVMACPETRALYTQALAEVQRVAAAQGIDLGADAVDRTLAFSASVHPGMRTSMQRDLEAGRRLELEATSGTVVRLGRAQGVPTPVHACIYACLKPHDLRAPRAGRQPW